VLINLLLSLLLFITYHLALTYVGARVRFLKTILPSLFLGLSAFLIRTVFQAPPVIYSTSIVVICAVLMFLFNKIDYLSSIIGSILSFTTFIVSSLLIACPIMVTLGFEVPRETKGLPWILINLAEFAVPTIVIFILKTCKFNLAKYLRNI